MRTQDTKNFSQQCPPLKNHNNVTNSAVVEINSRKIKNQQDRETFRDRMIKNMVKEKEIIQKAKSVNANKMSAFSSIYN